MNQVIKNLTIDLDRQQMRSEITVPVKQGDNASREITVTLRADGVVWEVPQSATLRLRLLKPDNTAVYDGLPKSTDGKVHITLGGQMLTAAGTARGDIEIKEGDALLSTFLFYLDISDQAIPDGTIESAPEFGALQTLITQAESAIEECESAAEGVTEAKEEAHTNAVAAATAASLANQKAQDAETAAGNAQEQASAAQTGAAAANSAASAANTAADRANEAAEAVEGLDVSQLKQQVTALENGKMDKVMLADYVEEEGTIGAWRYRKWHGGTAECWARLRTPVALESTGIEGIYKGVVNLELPAGLFTDTPVVTGGVIQHFNNWCAVAGSDASHAVVAYFQTNQNGNNTERAFDLYANGQWQEEADPDVPAYVTEAADNLASRVQGHLSGSSQYLRLAFPTDLHCGYDTDPENVSATHAGQALKRIRKRLDSVIGGGDYTSGGASTTAEDAVRDITAGLELLDYSGMGEDGLPYFFVLGNHDDSPYRATEDRVNEEAMNLLFGLAHLKSGFTMADSPLYGYRDFEGAKIRVICLNVRDTFGWESEDNPPESSDGTAVYRDVLNIGGEQLQWFANEALDMSGKSDAAEWGIIVCSHGRLTQKDSYYKGRYFNTANVVTLLDAYAQGQRGTVQADKVDSPYSVTDVGYDFTAPSRAQVICCIHGHNHAYLEEWLGTTKILAIGCPNVLNGRERQSQDGKTYAKTEDSAEDTSFCVVSVDRTKHRIYADHYGPGYDREWDYTEPEPEPGPGYTNQIPTSTDKSGGIYNGTGYKTDTRLNSSGNETGARDTVVTGYIPFSKGDVLRVRGGYWDGNGACYVQLYDAARELIHPINYDGMLGGKYGTVTFGGSDTGKVRDMTYICDNITGTTSSGKSVDDTAYVRISCRWLEEDPLIATVNEEIK